MSASLRSWDGWQADRGARVEALRAIAGAPSANADDIARAITREMGKPMQGGAFEALGAAAYFDYYADLESPVTTIRHDDEVHVELRRTARQP